MWFLSFPFLPPCLLFVAVLPSYHGDYVSGAISQNNSLFLKSPLVMFYYRSRKGFRCLLKTPHLHIKKSKTCGTICNYKLVTIIKVLLLSKLTFEVPHWQGKRRDRYHLTPAVLKMRTYTNQTRKSKMKKNVCRENANTLHPPGGGVGKWKPCVYKYIKNITLYFKTI